ncbi:hypothetical protein ACOTTU_01655 [Roseobacter sp. EG26]|uniref:hypothetical protein n=1 Tax=Roseobacter sp. EG26 TaxID=3412477 RepID=UPI003CE50130
MEKDGLYMFEDRMVGQRCLSIKRRENDWLFEFSGGSLIALNVPWRIVCKGRILFVDEDDGQLFGNSEPVDGELVANNSLGGQSIAKAALARETGDLALHFSDNLRLDAFNNSSGYEGWTATCNFDGVLFDFVALGGGEIMIKKSTHGFFC